MRFKPSIFAAFLLFGLLGTGWGSLPPTAQAQSAAAGSEAADFEGLAEGPGREAVYFTCTACHSLNQFTQQRMSREDWDGAITRMVEVNKMAPPKPWARTLILSYLSTQFGTDAEDWDGLAPGPGREEVFYQCQPCHSLAIVKQQRLSRKSWEETLHWMVEEQGMPEPDHEEWTAILDYLGSRLGQDAPR